MSSASREPETKAEGDCRICVLSSQVRQTEANRASFTGSRTFLLLILATVENLTFKLCREGWCGCRQEYFILGSLVRAGGWWTIFFSFFATVNSPASLSLLEGSFVRI